MAIEAAYDSTCPACSEPIAAGDLITRDDADGRYVHEHCGPPTVVVSTRLNPGICPVCRMGLSFPVHGNCRTEAAFAEARGEAVPVTPRPPTPAGTAIDITQFDSTMARNAVAGLPEGDEIVAAWVDSSGQLVKLTSRPEPRRDQWKRYLLPTPEGEEKGHTRVTTICKKIDSTEALMAWKERMVAHGIGLREELYATAASHRDPNGEHRKIYTQLVRDAHAAAGSNKKRTLGTALHRFIECLDLGLMTLDDVPTIWRAQCKNYQDTLAANGIRIIPELVEQVYVKDRNTVAGMGDRALRLPDRRLPVIADLKTGSTLKWSVKAIAAQLAAYQDHDATYDYRTETRGPKVELDPHIGIVIHLPQDGTTCELIQYNLAVGREAFEVGLEVHAIQRMRDDQVAVPYVPKACLAPYEWIVSRLQGLLGMEGYAVDDIVAWLNAYWPAEVRSPFPIDPTEAEVAAMDAFLVPLERELGAPFTVGVAA